jgi:hypothetical protein
MHSALIAVVLCSLFAAPLVNAQCLTNLDCDFTVCRAFNLFWDVIWRRTTRSATL